MRRVLVTGAYGFIGRHVSRRLAGDGWHVTGVDLRADDAGMSDWGIGAWHSGAVTPALLETLETPQLVVHCAAPSTVGIASAQPYETLLDTLAGTAAVLDYLRRANPAARHIYLSSAAVYGEVEALPIREDASLAPVSPYGAFKQQAEMLCGSYDRFFGVRSVAVRPFSVYGPGQRKQLLWDACRKFAAGTPDFGGNGAEVRDWLHVEDLAALVSVLAAAETFEAVAINAGSGTGSTVRDVLALVARAFDGQKPAFSGQQRAGDPSAYVADIARATALGWAPKIDLADGIAGYVEWFRAL